MHRDEVVVFDEPHECAYLPGRMARLPHRFPLARLAPEEFDQRLAQGDRRSGVLLYRTQCAGCRACEPIRLDVTRFAPGRTQRRILRKGDRLLSCRVGEPIADGERVALFNRHRRLRQLEHGDDPVDVEAYAHFLVESCCNTWEISYQLEGRIVCVAITDVGAASLSAVYCFFDPALAHLSLGTYSILKQAELCRQTGRRHLYLGYYVAQSPHMSYKARFHPHERLIGGRWREFL
jgi:arginine-tRNA-protein transferase